MKTPLFLLSLFISVIILATAVTAETVTEERKLEANKPTIEGNWHHCKRRDCR